MESVRASNIWQASGSYYSSGLFGGNVLLTLGRYNNFPYRLFCQWSLPSSLIPDGSVITQARLQFTAYPQSGSQEFGGGISKVNYDLNGSTPYGTLFTEAGDTANYLGGASATGGVVDQTFSQGAFTNAIAAGLPNDRFTIAIQSVHEVLWAYWYYVFTGSLKLTIWFVPPGSVTVDQVFEAGNRVDGSSIYRWESGSFVAYTVPHTFQFNLNSTETFRADVNLWTNPQSSNLEKYRTWNGLSDVVNHKDFQIQLGFTRAESQFKAASNAIIQSQLIDVSLVGGTIDFKDPWLINDNSDPKGSRNRGMNAIWHNQTSPFTITTSDPSYKGVFLSQSFASGTYYSVGAPNPKLHQRHRVVLLEVRRFEPKPS